jgi:membrane protein DedA with SNARE-associated domain
MSGTVSDGLLGVLRDHMALAQPVVFILGFAEGIPVLSLFVPSTALFLGIGVAHSAVGGTFVPMWMAASAGAVLGDLVTYALGRYFKADAARMWPLSRKPGLLAAGNAYFQRWGALAVLAGKFLGVVRPVIPLIAGMTHMPLWIYVPASIASSIAWAGVFLSPGYGISWLALQ